VPQHLRAHGGVARERRRLAPAVHEAERAEHGHEQRAREQPRGGARIPGPQLHVRVQPDDRVEPRHPDGEQLTLAVLRREGPEHQRHARVGVLHAVELPGDPRADDVGDEQRRDRESERELRGLPERHAQRAPLVERPERERDVREQ
jgi:hypothetical protein